jgi:DNA polymerase-3 subunit alpha
VAANCTLDIPEWNSRSWHIPKFTAPEQKDSHAYLCELVKAGLKERGLTSPTYIARAKHELKIMKSVGMADFLLITRDIIQRAKAKGIRVGIGRGSTGASLVGMVIGVHGVDPVRFNLLFERFLNPERPKMPDIDTDFSQARRDEVIQDIKDTYGAENVLPVAAFGTLQFKSVFQVLAKAHGIEFQERMKWSKLMEEDEEGGTILPKELSQAYPDLLDQMLKIVGTKRSIASHPSGVIIFDPKDSVRKLVPQMWLPKSGQRQGRFIAAFDLKSAEKMGLMKQDILGLRTLDTIAECIALLDRRHGDSKAQWCDPDAWVPDEEARDKDVYKMLASGDTAGVFQLEGATNSRGIVEMKPKEFNDIVHTTAMYRAGPIGAGAPSRYLKNKKDKKVRVLHPSLEPILAETHGEMIYQESLMQIVNKVAGLSMTKVDEIKEIVRFKDAAKMNAFLDEFISGCVETVGMDKETAQKLWLTIEAQSTYLYNKIHATSYSLLTYQTARLKCLWPLEFYTALLRTVLGKNPEEKAKRVRYLTCCINLGFRILPPDINKSDTLTTCFGKRSIRMGFQDVKGIGPAAATKLTDKRYELYKFSSLEQVSKELGEGLYKKLAAVGALYNLGGPTAKPRVLEEMTGWCFNDEMALVREKFKKEVMLPTNQDGQVHIIGEIISTEKRKTKSGKPFMTWKLRWSPAEVFNITIWEDAEILWTIPLHSVVSVSGKYQKEFSNVACGSSEQVQTIRRASGS